MSVTPDGRPPFLVWTAGALAGSLAGACGLTARGTGEAVPADEAPMDAARFHGARRFAKLDAGRIAYVLRGAGPVALFLHGFPLNSFQWRGVVDRVRAHRRCLTLNCMGLGYSDVPAGQSLALHAQATMLVKSSSGSTSAGWTSWPMIAGDGAVVRDPLPAPGAHYAADQRRYRAR